MIINLNPNFLREINAEDESKRLLIEMWDWDRASRDDFMGELSFGVSEIIRRPVDCWFKLLSKEEGEFYSIPCFDAKTNAIFNMQRLKYEVSSIPHRYYIINVSLMSKLRAKDDVGFKVVFRDKHSRGLLRVSHLSTNHLKNILGSMFLGSMVFRHQKKHYYRVGVQPLKFINCSVRS